MKKAFILLAAFAIFATSFAATGFSYVPKKASEILLPIAPNAQISLKDLSVISVKNYEKLSGKHLNFFEKMSFKAGQKKLRNSIAADGTVTNTKLLKAMSNADPGTGFNIGWFALGLFLGIIGVILSYVINGDQAVKKNRQKWAWIGFGVVVVIILISLL
jgi:hypothetical protein